MRVVSTKPGHCALVACVLAGLGSPAPTPASADSQGPCCALPRNASPAPELSTEGYPRVDRAQRWSVEGEILGASVANAVRRPLRSAFRLVGRASERSIARVQRLSSCLGLEGPTDGIGLAGDGVLDAPIGSPPMPATLTLLPTSNGALQGLLELAASAERRLDLMMYGWEDDPTGRAVGDALAAAAQRGVRVRVLVDRGGFLIHNPAASAGLPTFLDRLRAVPGVSVIEPPNPFFQFDHRKLAVVDGRTAWSGGMILTEVARTRWENVAFLAEGPVVAHYAAVFEERWRQAGGAPGEPPAGAMFAGSPPNATVRMIRTEPHDQSFKDAIYHAVDHARQRVYVENCYFSDALLAEKLVAARRRGVDVRVVTTLRGNVSALNRYLVLQANRLVRGGVRVYLAPGMTHVKTMTADGVWTYLGTGNFDELSLRHNREVGLAVTSPVIAQALEATVLVPHMAAAEELTRLLPPPPDWPLLELFSLWL